MCCCGEPEVRASDQQQDQSTSARGSREPDDKKRAHLYIRQAGKVLLTEEGEHVSLFRLGYQT